MPSRILLKIGLIGSMPLQLSEFTDLPLLFIILEPCHYNFKILRNMPLHTPSTCFSKFMDQNTPSLLPLIPSLFPLSPWQIPGAAGGASSGGHRHRGQQNRPPGKQARAAADRSPCLTPHRPLPHHSSPSPSSTSIHPSIHLI